MSDYKKMNGSLDSSLDKSQFNSSMEEDTQSFDIYEAHNPPAAEAVKPSSFDIAYRNEGKLWYILPRAVFVEWGGSPNFRSLAYNNGENEL